MFLYLPQADDPRGSSCPGGGLYLCSFSVCLCSFMLPDASVSEGLQPGSVLTLEPATSATHQLSPTATDSLVKSALFKSVAEIQLALDS